MYDTPVAYFNIAHFIATACSKNIMSISHQIAILKSNYYQ